MAGQSLYQDSGFQRVSLKQNINYKGWLFQAHGEFAGKFESSNLSRDNITREIGRKHPSFETTAKRSHTL